MQPHIIEFNGRKGDAKFWAAETHLNVATIRTRILTLGWAPEIALTKPLAKNAPLPEAGEKYGRLTIKKSARIFKKGDGKRIYCRCDCECGSKNVVVMFRNMINGTTESCGCIRRERMRKFNKQRSIK